MKQLVILILGMALCTAEGHAQNNNKQGTRKVLDDFLKEASDDLDSFRKESRKDFEAFRQQCMKEYADFMRNPWKSFEEKKPLPAPKKDTVPPVVMPEEDKQQPKEDNQVKIDEVVKPTPVEPQPQPVAPIEVVPIENQPTVGFVFFGTDGTVRFDKSKLIRLQGIKESSIAQAFEQMSGRDYDNMIVDCLQLREDLNLGDWAYLQMLKALSDRIAGIGTNEATLLMAYLYMQSGYKMRLAASDSHLYMLYASKHTIYNREYYNLDGDNYYGVVKLPNRLHVCQAAFPKEKSMSLRMDRQPKLCHVVSPKRTITSKRYTDMSVKVSVNINLIDFYNTYPASMTDNNFMTCWAMYANIPMSQEVKAQLYGPLKEKLKGCTQLESVNKLLNWVQTGFVYEYDDKVWGYDRTFFAEESLFYPYCDCEDRSVLFTRLVRDLLGLDCVLVYYPGHLASAVAITSEEAKGDYFVLNGKKYILADATYINASVGSTMPGMNNQAAKVILLERGK